MLVAGAFGLLAWWAALPVAAAESPGTARRSADPRIVRAWSTASSPATLVGLAHARSLERFFAIEASAEGTSLRIVTMDTFGEPVAATDLPLQRHEAVGLVYDERNARLLLHDDRLLRLRAMALTESGVPDPASLVELPTPRVGPLRPAGTTIDVETGALHVLDRLTRRVLRFTPAAPGSAVTNARWIALGDLAARDLDGLAYDETRQSFFLMEPSTGVLYETTSEGGFVTTHDLDETGGDNPAFVVAPTGDRTDDPDRLDLYFGGSGPGGIPRITELSLEAREPLAVSAALTATLVRTTATSQFPIPSPDPSGLTYDAASNRLFLVDGEVEEVRIWSNVNFYEVTLDGTYVRGVDFTPFSIEPVGVARGPGRLVFVSDDDSRQVYVIDMGPDGLVGTVDDSRTQFDTRDFGSDDPEGITYDPTNHRLFIADGVNSEIYEIAPGLNGIFDGTDDVVTHFDTGRLGANDPECVEYNAARGTLFLIGSSDDFLLETTTSGDLVNSWDVAFLNQNHAAGMTFAPGSLAPGEQHVYLCHRNVDNDSDSSENDGTLSELALFGGSGPPAPGPSGLTVRMAGGGDDAEESATGSVSVTGSDLELVNDGNDQVVGLRFPALAIARGARIDSAFIQFTADESHNGATSLTLSGHAIDNAPAFTSATRNVSARERTTTAVTWTPLAWTASQAGAAQRSPNVAAIVEEIVRRGGWASGNAIAFVITGTGRRVAEAYEAGANIAPRLVVHVATGTNPPVNRAPVVNAGADQTLLFPSPATLDATVSDDALPEPPALTTRWSVFSGPPGGIVTFGNPDAVDTQAGFSAPGRYVLRLTADDGPLDASDTVAIRLIDPATVPVVVQRRIALGSDDVEESASGSMSLTGGDLELVLDGNLQTVGLRFPDLAIARGAKIDSAFIQFTADESQSEATSLQLQGHATDHAPTFTTAARNASSRPRTTAAVAWTPAAWTAGQAVAAQRSPDLAPVVQEIVSRGGWASGNALAFVITGTGRRIARSFEAGASQAALLVVYIGQGTVPPVNRAPVVNAGVDQTLTLGTPAALDGTVSDDGLPEPPGLTTGWSVFSKPATAIVTFGNPDAVDTQAGFSEVGRYVLQLAANDREITTTDTVAIQVLAPGSIPVTVERRVAAGSDDAEQKTTSTSVSLTSGDLELVDDGGVQLIGMRFTGLGLPPGATVTRAWVQFKADVAGTVATALTVRAQAADAAPTFSSTANLSSRSLTTAAVSWNPPAWTAGLAADAQRTPDLSAVLNELTRRATWTSTSPVVIMVTGTGKRVAKSFEGEAAGAPLLHVEYLR